MTILSNVFINYRRQGEAYAAALLDERLSKYFGSERIFRASRSIIAGADYELSILNAIEKCGAILVLIGVDWPAALLRNPLEDRDDWVRREILEAFKRDIPVIPVLLTGATRFTEQEVPADLARIARCQYLRFDYRNLDEDSNRIARELRRVVPSLVLQQHFDDLGRSEGLTDPE